MKLVHHEISTFLVRKKWVVIYSRPVHSIRLSYTKQADLLTHDLQETLYRLDKSTSLCEDFRDGEYLAVRASFESNKLGKPTPPVVAEWKLTIWNHFLKSIRMR